MKIYDCITYLNEDLILDLRFNILNKYVDYFVIVESNKTHSGESKKKNFDINLKLPNSLKDAIDASEKYNPELLDKDKILAISKSDMLDDELKEEITELGGKPVKKKHLFSYPFTSIQKHYRSTTRLGENWSRRDSKVIKNLLRPLSVYFLKKEKVLHGWWMNLVERQAL